MTASKEHAQNSNGSAHPPLDQQQADAPAGYVALSRDPLHILLFLLPLIALYHVGSWFYLRNPEGGQHEMIAAEGMLGHLFSLFGLGGALIPAIFIVLMLLIWKSLVGGQWKPQPRALLGMTIESVAWALPVIVLGQILVRLLGGGSAALSADAGAGILDQADAPLLALATIAIGAGIYEEFAFRLILMELVHSLATLFLGMKDKPARILAAAISAIAFALYHTDQVFPAAGGISIPYLGFYIFAGTWLAMVYLWRSFGVCAGAHAAYNIIVVAILPALAGG